MKIYKEIPKKEDFFFLHMQAVLKLISSSTSLRINGHSSSSSSSFFYLLESPVKNLSQSSSTMTTALGKINTLLWKDAASQSLQKVTEKASGC